MKKKIIFTTFLSLVAVFCFFNFAYADTTVHLDVEAPTGALYNQNITVTPCDNEGTTAITAYCALLQSGVASDWSGLWVNSIGGVVNNTNNNGIYWMWLVNYNTNDPYSDFNCHQDAPYSCSAKQYILNPNDDILFYYSLTAPTPPSTPVVGSGGGQLNDPAPSSTSSNTNTTATSRTATPAVITPPVKPTFDINKAIDFLTAQQNNDGSFGSDLYTDWTALALASSGNSQNQIIKLNKYYEEEQLSNPSLTDYERHAMALMALGLNPYNTNGENYISDIVKGFDGKKFGDPNEDNEDIFALIVLQNAGYTQNDSIINTDVNFILSKQGTDGSWDSSVDMTGAAMEALSAFNQIGQVRDALAKAENFLEQNQKSDGSWNENASSTAWAMEGILAQNEKPENWSSSEGKNTPLDYLATIQDTDGGVKDSDLQTKIWETSYVTSALSGKTWNQIMQSFSKENLSTPNTTTSTANTNIVAIKNIENKITKIENPATQNTALITNAVTPQISETTTPPQNWFERLLAKIF